MGLEPANDQSIAVNDMSLLTGLRVGGGPSLAGLTGHRPGSPGYPRPLTQGRDYAPFAGRRSSDVRLTAHSPAHITYDDLVQGLTVISYIPPKEK